jgi:hypothetical protein
MLGYPLVDRHRSSVSCNALQSKPLLIDSARGGPLEDLLHRPCRDDPLRRDAQSLGPLAAQRLEVELARRVRVGVDGEPAAEIGGQVDELVRRVLSLRPRVDLDSNTA